MENEFYTDEFEQLLKEKADQFSMYPSAVVQIHRYKIRFPSFNKHVVIGNSRLICFVQILLV